MVADSQKVERVIGLFKFIKELVTTKFKVVTDIKNQEWSKYISAIHNDEKNISIPSYSDVHDENTFYFKSKSLILIHRQSLPKKLLSGLLMITEYLIRN